MKEITNFREFNQDKNAPSIQGAKNKKPISKKDIVLDYMKGFQEDVICPVRIRDEFTGENINKTLIYYTDGEFVWDEREIYHFEHYNLTLNNEFLDKVINS